jgi:hypothetical protein
MTPMLGPAISPDVILPTGGAAGPPDQTIIASGFGSALNANQLLVNVTVPAGSTNVVVVAKCLMEDGSGTASIDNATANGANMSVQASAFGTKTMAVIFTKLSPASGSLDIEMTSDFNAHLYLIVEVWANVASFGTGAAASGTSTTASATVAASQPASTMYIEATTADGGASPVSLTPGAGQSASGHRNAQYGTSPNIAQASCSQKVSSGTNVAMSETVQGTREWSIAVLPMRHV